MGVAMEEPRVNQVIVVVGTGNALDVDSTVAYEQTLASLAGRQVSSQSSHYRWPLSSRVTYWAKLLHVSLSSWHHNINKNNNEYFSASTYSAEASEWWQEGRCHKESSKLIVANEIHKREDIIFRWSLVWWSFICSISHINNWWWRCRFAHYDKDQYDHELVSKSAKNETPTSGARFYGQQWVDRNPGGNPIGFGERKHHESGYCKTDEPN